MVLSLIVDRNSASKVPIVKAFDISVYFDGKIDDELSEFGTSGFVQVLASTIKSIQSSKEPAQVYCFSAEEVSTIEELIVHEFSKSASEDVRNCICALIDSPIVLQTTIQPELLKNALFDPCDLKMAELKHQLHCLGEDQNGNRAELIDRLRQALNSDNNSFRQLFRIIPIQPVLMQLVAFRRPGCTTLQDYTTHLHGLSKSYMGGELRERGIVIYDMITRIRSEVLEIFPKVLINDAQPLSSTSIGLVKNEIIRKLIFIYEVRLAETSSLTLV